jgi:hypothetical protein
MIRLPRKLKKLMKKQDCIFWECKKVFYHFDKNRNDVQIHFKKLRFT